MADARLIRKGVGLYKFLCAQLPFSCKNGQFSLFYTEIFSIQKNSVLRPSFFSNRVSQNTIFLNMPKLEQEQEFISNNGTQAALHFYFV